jgi:hypothetical protein
MNVQDIRKPGLAGVSNPHNGHHRQPNRADFTPATRRAAWIHRMVLRSQPGTVLDLACHNARLRDELRPLGHRCVGCCAEPETYCPASNAQQCISKPAETCCLPAGHFDLVTMLEGRANALTPAALRALVSKARDALVAGGVLLLEVRTFQSVRDLARRERTWTPVPAQTQATRGCVRLQEARWDCGTWSAQLEQTTLDTRTGQARRAVHRVQAYSDAQYLSMLREAGLIDVTLFPPSMRDSGDGSLQVLAARKPIYPFVFEACC